MAAHRREPNSTLWALLTGLAGVILVSAFGLFLFLLMAFLRVGGGSLPWHFLLLVLGMLAGVGLLMLSFHLWRRARFRLEASPSTCPWCGYDISGLDSPTCPECGRVYKKEQD